MNRSPIRWAAFACTAAALALTSAVASAQSITLSDPNCSDFSLGGSPGNRTLTCVVNTPSACTVTGATTGTIGNNLILTASCSPAATSWAWTGGNCAAVTASTCTDNGTGMTNGQVVQYTVTGTNASGTAGASPQHAVTWSNTPPQVPSSCSIAGAPTGSVSAGTQVTLTINCTAGGTANAWAWTSGSSATTQTIGPITVNSTTTFTAKASADGGTTFGSPVSATVNIGGGGGGISCSGFAATHVINVSWGATGTVLTSDFGGFGPNDALVFKFTTPANGGTLTKKGSVSAAEYGDPSASRYGTLSTVACDFAGTNAPTITGTTPPQQQIFCLATQTACSTNVSFGITFNPAKSGAALLLPGTTYYVNIGNWHPSGQSFNMIWNWSWPTL